MRTHLNTPPKFLSCFYFQAIDMALTPKSGWNGLKDFCSSVWWLQISYSDLYINHLCVITCHENGQNRYVSTNCMCTSGLHVSILYYYFCQIPSLSIAPSLPRVSYLRFSLVWRILLSHHQSIQWIRIVGSIFGWKRF